MPANAIAIATKSLVMSFNDCQPGSTGYRDFLDVGADVYDAAVLEYADGDQNALDDLWDVLARAGSNHEDAGGAPFDVPAHHVAGAHEGLGFLPFAIGAAIGRRRSRRDGADGKTLGQRISGAIDRSRTKRKSRITKRKRRFEGRFGTPEEFFTRARERQESRVSGRRERLDTAVERIEERHQERMSNARQRLVNRGGPLANALVRLGDRIREKREGRKERREGRREERRERRDTRRHSRQERRQERRAGRKERRAARRERRRR